MKTMPFITLALFLALSFGAAFNAPLASAATIDSYDSPDDLDQDPLVISEANGTLDKNLGGSQLTITDSAFEIDGSDAYSAGVAGYNTKAGEPDSSAPTAIDKSQITITKGNITSGLFSNDPALQKGIGGTLNITNSQIILNGATQADAIIYAYGNANAGQTVNITGEYDSAASEPAILVDNGQMGTILANYGVINITGVDTGIRIQKGGTLYLTTGTLTPDGIQADTTEGNKSVYNISSFVDIDGSAAKPSILASANPGSLTLNFENAALHLTNGKMQLYDVESGQGAEIKISSSPVSVVDSSIQAGTLDINLGANNTLDISGGSLEGVNGVLLDGSVALTNSSSNPGQIIFGSAEGAVNGLGPDLAMTVSGNGEMDLGQGVTMKGGAITINSGAALSVNNGELGVQAGQIANSGTLNVGSETSATIKFAEGSQEALDSLLANGNVALGGSSGAEPGTGALDFGAADLSLDASKIGDLGDTSASLQMGAGSSVSTTGNLTLTGTTLATNKDAILAANDVDFSSEDGTPVNFSSGTIKSAGADAEIRGAVNLSTDSATLELGGEDATGGTISAPITVDGGTLAINGGNWTLAAETDITINSGSLGIGGQNVAAALDITQGSLTGNSAGADVSVAKMGTLTADMAQLWESDNAKVKIDLANDGTLTLNNIGETSVQKLADIRDAILWNRDSTGQINWNDAEYSGVQPGALAEEIGVNTISAPLGYGANYDPENGSRVEDGAVSVAQTDNVGGTYLVLAGDNVDENVTTLKVGPDSDAAYELTLLGTGGTSPLLASDEEGTQAANIKTVEVGPNSGLTLGDKNIPGTQGGSLGADVVLHDGSRLTAANASFQVGKVTPVNSGEGEVNVNSGAALKTAGIGSADAPLGKITNRGTLTTAGDIYSASLDNSAGVLKTDNLSVTDEILNKGGKLQVTGQASLGTPEGTLKLDSGEADFNSLNVTGALAVGAASGSAPVFTAKSVDLSEGRLIFDHNGSGIAKASIQELTNGADMDVLRNYAVSVGSSSGGQWLDTALTKAGQKIAAGGAALGVYSPITLKAGGTLTIGDTGQQAARMMASRSRGIEDRAAAPTQANTFSLGKNAVLVVNAAAAQGNGAIVPEAPAQGSANARATLNTSGKIEIAGAQPNQTYIVLGESKGRAAPVGWDIEYSDGAQAMPDSSLISDNPLVTELTQVPSGNTLVIRSGATADAATVMPGLSGPMANAVEAAANAGQIGTTPEFTHAGERGTQFLSRALVMARDGQGARAGRAVESAGRMVVLGAVPQMTLAANQSAGSAITQRATFAEPGSNLMVYNASGAPVNSSVRGESTALWVMPLFQSTNGFSMEAGPNDYDFSGTLGGVAFGADFTANDMARWGVAFNLGGGYAESGGKLGKTTNNMNFWGVGAYAGYKLDGLGLVADVFYTSTYNKLRQDTPSPMSFGTLKADVNSEAVSTGLRVDYTIPTDAMDITPHAGFRYTNLKTDSYKIKSEGRVAKGDAMWQNIWQFPFGVTMSRVVALEQGWRFKPLLDLDVIPATGDFKAKNKIRFTGTDTKAELETKTLDYITYGGTVGMEFGTDDLSFGVSYSGQFGEETSAHGVFGTFRYEF